MERNCVSLETANTKGPQTMTKPTTSDTKGKCPTCGAEFDWPAIDLPAHMKSSHNTATTTPRDENWWPERYVTRQVLEGKIELAEQLQRYMGDHIHDPGGTYKCTSWDDIDYRIADLKRQLEELEKK